MSKKAKNNQLQTSDNKPLLIVIIAAVLLLAVGAAVLILPEVIADKKAAKTAEEESVRVAEESRKAAEAAAKNYQDNMDNPSSEDVNAYSDFEETDEKTEYVKIDVAGHGEMIIKLDSATAPITVDNFQNLVYEKFYDGLTFHRIYKDFMIQGGDPNGNGTGGSGTTIKGEFSENGVENNLSHTRGVISMARKKDDMDSATSQFFICHANASASLDGKYAAFGKLVAGYKVLDSIASVEVQDNGSGEYSSPISPVVITSVRFVKLK